MAPVKKPKFTYSETDMKNAVRDVRQGVSASTASRIHNVPRSTLIYKATGKSPLGRKMGPTPTIGNNGEQMLVNWVKAVARLGFPVSKCDLLSSVEGIVKESKISNSFTNGKPGKKWLALFLKRHPEISERTVEKLSRERALITEAKVCAWFKEVETYLVENQLIDVLSAPSRIFNADETAFMLCPKGEKVLGIKGQKNVYELHNANQKESVTVLCNVGADGAIAPTMIVYPGQRLPQSIKLNVPESWAIARSVKGWMTGETFFEYIANVFYAWLIQEGIQLPVIMFLDGHSSHLTYHLSKFCSEHGIILIALPPNATHMMQPLDVAVFKPMKQAWAKAVHEWRMCNAGDRLTKYNFAPVLKTAMDVAMKETTIQNGFRTCGLFPFNADAIDFSKFCVQHTGAVMAGTSSEVQNLTSNPVSAVPAFSGLEFLESLINPTTLAEFFTTYNKFTPIWTGEEAAHDLYVVWKKAKDSTQSSLARFADSGAGNQDNETSDIVPTLQFGLSTPPRGNSQSTSMTTTVKQSSIPTAAPAELPSPPTPAPAKQSTPTAAPDELPSPPTPAQQSSTPTAAPVDLPSPPTPAPAKQSSTPTAASDELPSTSTVVPSRVADKKRDQLSRTLSPETNGAGVPSPFKNVLFWPGTPPKNATRRKIKLPSVVILTNLKTYEENKMKQKTLKEKEKQERREKKQSKEKKKPTKKEQNSKMQVDDEEEDWICKVCRRRYSAELILKTRRRWVECDQCKSQFHYKCIPKQHLDAYGLEEEDDDDDVAFTCHFCAVVDDSSDD